jgi:hypothetical protein
VGVQRVQAFDGQIRGLPFSHCDNENYPYAQKSQPSMMTPKSQFLLGKRRDNLRDKIILSECLTLWQAV